MLTKPPESFEITFVAENYLGCEVKALAYSIPLSLILVIVTSITSKGTVQACITFTKLKNLIQFKEILQ